MVNRAVLLYDSIYIHVCFTNALKNLNISQTTNNLVREVSR